MFSLLEFQASHSMEPFTDIPQSPSCGISKTGNVRIRTGKLTELFLTICYDENVLNYHNIVLKLRITQKELVLILNIYLLLEALFAISKFYSNWG